MSNVVYLQKPPPQIVHFCGLVIVNMSWWIACDQKETYRREGMYSKLAMSIINVKRFAS